MDYLGFSDPMVVARSMAQILTTRERRFLPRPLNQFQPETSLWWIVPGTNWPAYKYGKYVVFEFDGLFYCGLNVEKGFGMQAGHIYPGLYKKGMVTENDWMWNNFKKDLENDSFSHALNKVQCIYDETICVRIGSAVASDPLDYDPNATKSNELECGFKDGNLILVNQEINDDSLESLLDINKLSQIPGLLSSYRTLDLIWLDISITIPFRKPNANGSVETRTLDGEDVCRILEPLEGWVGLAR